MKNHKLKIASFALSLVFSFSAFAQEGEKVSIKEQFETYKDECSRILQDDGQEKMLQLMGNNKDSSSCYKLGMIYFDGLLGKPNYKMALKCFAKAMEYNIPEAQYMYSMMNFSGKYGVKTDVKKAVKMLMLAAENDYPLAQFELAEMMLSEKHFKKDEKVVVQMLTKAANSGLPKAQNLLGEIYFKGIKNVPKDGELAVKWLGEAADQGYMKSQYYLGFMFMKGILLKQNHKVARDWFLLAAKQGDAKSQYYLGLLFEKGLGGSADISEAKKWYEKSFKQDYFPSVVKIAELGDAKTQYRLAKEYAKGSDNVSVDEKEAFDWMKKSASQGNKDAQFDLGKMYFDGLGVAVDIDAASVWLEKAQKNGVEQSEVLLEKIRKIKQKKAEQEKINAKIQEEKDFIENNKKLYENANNGDVEAQYKLGNLYLNRDKKNDEYGKIEAEKWLVMSAENGNLKAMETVGEAYFNANKNNKVYIVIKKCPIMVDVL